MPELTDRQENIFFNKENNFKTYYYVYKISRTSKEGTG